MLNIYIYITNFLILKYNGGFIYMMKLTLKHLLVVSVILTLFLGLNLVSATNITDDSALSTKNICTHSITSDSNIDVNDINNYVKKYCYKYIC